MAHLLPVTDDPAEGGHALGLPPLRDADLRSPLDHFLHWEQVTPHAVLLRQPFGREWHTLTYAECGAIARRMAAALGGLGLQRGDRIGILSKNCQHWILADLAIMMGGFVSVPFYPSTPAGALSDLVERSGIRALFIGKLDQWAGRGEAVPGHVHCIRFPHYPGNAHVERGLDWDDLVAAHAPPPYLEPPTLDDVWSIFYTSGTTGSPKGVVHTYRHPALIIAGERASGFIGVFKVPQQRYFSFLPLNHVAERIAVEVNCLATGGSMSFGENIDTFIRNLQETQPTTFFAVPRIWTKFHQGVVERVPERALDLLLALPLLGPVVRRRIRKGLGLGDAVTVITGAAVTPRHIKRFFHKLGIHLVEAYGMTEVCGAIANGVDPDTPEDSVGRVVPNCHVRIDPATGEVLMRSPYAMVGYHDDAERTAAVLRDGWIHSGDKGRMDDQGYLYITGRINDAFKTAKGQFINPGPTEERMVAHPDVEQVCLVGRTAPQPIALLDLGPRARKAQRSSVERSLLDHLAVINAGLANHERISTLVIVREPWTEENGLLTPTLKVRRERIDARYADLCPAWHEDTATVIWE